MMSGVENQQLSKEAELFNKTLEYIPNGTQTLSKSPNRFVDGVYPKFISYSKGCHAFTLSTPVLTDFICGLGPIILGHRDEAVDGSVIAVIKEFGTCFSLPSPMELYLAEKIEKQLWHGDKCKVKYFKTGSEVLSAAVRVARAYTGREKILVCGYHGWHDWYVVQTIKNAGIPKCLIPLTQSFKYNDLDDFRNKLTSDVAAVVMEPVVYEAPNKEFLETIRKLTETNGSLLIFDEVVTGLRFPKNWFNYVIPDISCFSKALGNGYPIGAVVGKPEIMNTFERDDFMASGTFGGELIGISAAMAVLSRFENGEIRDHIWAMGTVLKTKFNKLCEKLGLEKIKCSGYPPRTFFDFPSSAHKALFWQETMKRRILFGYANFICYAHKEWDIWNALNASEEALKIVKENYSYPEKKLEGKMPVEVFRLR